MKIKDLTSIEADEKIVRISEKVYLRLNINELKKLLTKIKKLRTSKIQSIEKTPNIDREEAINAYKNLAKVHPEPIEEVFQNSEYLAKFISYRVITSWNGMKKSDGSEQQFHPKLGYSLLLKKPSIIRKIVDIGEKQIQEMSKFKN